ncbi:hypothetical protein DTO164E3_6616 [Paecilomyces variotii]|nr:hypothetical protein DTO164E3_6616 [Paecilomyces variotii]
MALHQILRDHHNSTQSQPGGKSKVLSQARLGELLALDAHGSNADGDNREGAIRHFLFLRHAAAQSPFSWPYCPL